METAGRELAELMRPAEPEIVVSVATMGIPLAIEAVVPWASTTT